MSTGSTKSQSRNRQRSVGGTTANAPAGAGTNATAVIPEHVWQVASISILAAAAFLRLYALTLKPLHHDEGVNGFFLTRLFREGVYQYDPANYHGPTLYYFAVVIPKLTSKLASVFPSLAQHSLNTFVIRLVPAAFGVATVWLVLLLRRRLGSVGALSAAALLAVSPGAVYLSRYFIHESLFVFFTLGIVVAALNYYDSARPVYLMLAAVSAALLFATKETAIISVLVLVIAAASTAIYMRLRRSSTGRTKKDKRAARRKYAGQGAPQEQQQWREPLARFGEASDMAVFGFAAVTIFVLVNVLFYSSFFTHAKGVSDAVETFKFWTKTGKTEHVHEWYTYLSWLWQEESPLLLLGAAGAAMAVWRARNRFALFAALWAFGILAAYSLVPYKTPWLTLNIIVPLAIIGGYAANLIYWGGRRTHPVALALTLAAALGVCVYQTITLNFYHYDDDAYVYVYAHTRRQFLSLVDDINLIAERAGTGHETTISVSTPDYWPLPWYLLDYSRVGYHGRISVSGEAIVIGSETQELELQAALGDRYRQIGSYSLRPGVTLVLYARRDLAGQ